MERIGRKTMRCGEAFFEKNSADGLVAKKSIETHADSRELCTE
jgi:hypothetical protein